MDGSTKILTVSYGTFSCTLEGFDDPLGAMRDIAEYFRDLAADDRYFGAEPPTPDVEMLQSIAEREVNRRVEARTSETGVALRQVAHDPKPVETAPQPETPNKVEQPVEDAGALAARVVSAAKATDVVTEAAPKEDTPDTGTGPLTFDDEFLMADEPEDVLAIDPSASVEADGPAESVAEKLRRIRAVVSRNIDAKVEAAEVVDDASTEAAAKRDRALTETIEAITADLAEEDQEDEAIAPEDSLDAEADPQSEPTEADGEAKTDQDDSEDVGAEDNRTQALDENAARDTSQPLWVRDEEAEASASDADLLSDDADDDDDEDDDGAESLFLDNEEGDEDADEDTDADDEQTKLRVSDIIGNVANRIDDDGAEENDAFEDDLEDAIAASKPAGESDDERDARAKRLSGDQDEDVGRLMAETDTKLNEDDVVRRRRVISQMRAAVAATKADRLVSRHVPREETEEEERSPYRNDLSEVVRTATAAPEGGERPKTSSPPLVLVSSQRVHADEEDESDADANDVPEDFADFAETMGATELSELLEAAAAYTVFSEGNPSFTRPEIMKRVAAVDPTIRMSREESLRSFGQLLRQGKFRKLERGQFTIDQDTKFNPKHRIAGE